MWPDAQCLSQELQVFLIMVMTHPRANTFTSTGSACILLENFFISIEHWSVTLKTFTKRCIIALLFLATSLCPGPAL
jgi:hypothetical protein